MNRSGDGRAYQNVMQSPEYITGPVGLPVVEPPIGSMLTASIL